MEKGLHNQLKILLTPALLLGDRRNSYLPSAQRLQPLFLFCCKEKKHTKYSSSVVFIEGKGFKQ